MTGYEKNLRAEHTPIPGLILWDLPVHGDNRGWFKENWQRAKMTEAGLPDGRPVQNNISLKGPAGTTRGFHAEPWDKFVSVAVGRIYGAWVDLRSGPTFGRSFTAELDPSRAVFIPRGVGNAFQTLEPETVYTYLVNEHYSAEATYTSLNLADESIGIEWPVPLQNAELSTKDRNSPHLQDIQPIEPRKMLVLGANGQVGRALREALRDERHVEFADRVTLDLKSQDLSRSRKWSEYHTVINAAAYTAVDTAETPEGRVAAWDTNVAGVAALARVAATHGITLVNISTDYVFDGRAVGSYHEDDPVSPTGVYGQTKAAGDQIVASVAQHYIVRTSWVIGDGSNFVRKMLSLAERGVDPLVVNDQIGRLTFASEVARAILHLTATRPPYGIYNITCAGEPVSWAEIAKKVFSLSSHDPSRVSAVSTEYYLAKGSGPVAPRPKNSTLDLSKIRATGFEPSLAYDLLVDYVTAATAPTE